MTSPDTNNKEPRDPAEKSRAGKGAASGAFLVGVVLFAITQNPVWLAIGVAIGATAGAAVGKTSEIQRQADTD